LKRLAEKLQEIEKNREHDKDLILKKLEDRQSGGSSEHACQERQRRHAAGGQRCRRFVR